MAERMFRVKWTEVSTHEVELTATELADLAGGVSLDQMDAVTSYSDLSDVAEFNLADELANLEDDGFEGLTREDIEVTPL